MSIPTNPAEWRDFLNHALNERWGKLKVYDAYYEGDQNLAFVTRKFNDAYGSLFKVLTDNWMQIVVNASVERLRVQGFRFDPEGAADKDANAIWQFNNLDSESTLVHTEAVKLGWAYWMIAPASGDEQYPRMTAEHPSQVIVYTAPGDRRNRLAAFKRWSEGDEVFANVYLPDRVVKYRSDMRTLQVEPVDSSRRWETVGAEGNPLGVVPVVPVLNNPDMLRGGKSDLSGGATKIQDALNVLLADLLIGAEYQAYPLRVLLGVETPVDSTGKPIKNAEQAVSQARLLMFPNENAKVAEFSEAKLEAFIGSMEVLVQHLTAQTRTPPHYVTGKMVNVSGDALKAAETGLVSKVRMKWDWFGEAHEEAIRTAFKAIDREDERGQARDAETIWRDPESRSQAETVDAAVKLAAIGVPNEALWERVGASPQEIERWKVMRQVEAQEADALAALGFNGVPNPNLPSPNGGTTAEPENAGQPT